MHRFYLPPEDIEESSLTLRDREAHHAANVLRLQRGQRVSVLDGVGNEFFCEIQNINRKAVTLALIQKHSTPAPRRQITLLQAIPKGKIFDSILQKAVELGTNRIVPLSSERVTSHINSDQIADKVEKWRTTAIEAIKQSGQRWLPVIDPPVTPRQFLDRKEHFDLALIGSLQESTQHPGKYFEEFRREHDRAPRTAAVWIGPEGDFSQAEIEQIVSSGVLPISLGELVLRCETAAICCLAILNYEMRMKEPDASAYKARVA